MALIAGAMTTLADVKAMLGITDTTQDARLELLLNRISAMIAHYCDRVFTRTTYTSETYTGTNRQALVLRQWPVVSVSSVAVNGTTMAATEYEVKTQDQAMGAIYKAGGWYQNSNYATGLTLDTWAVGRDYAVTYVAGYYMPGDVTVAPADPHYVVGDPASLPLDLVSLCETMVSAANLAYKYQAIGLKRISEGGLTYEWGAAGGFGVHGLPNELEAVIARYSRRVVA
jgi:hypothetical protein